jgi:hypothetical protein
VVRQSRERNPRRNRRKPRRRRRSPGDRKGKKNNADLKPSEGEKKLPEGQKPEEKTPLSKEEQEALAKRQAGVKELMDELQKIVAEARDPAALDRAEATLKRLEDLYRSWGSAGGETDAAFDARVKEFMQTPRAVLEAIRQRLALHEEAEKRYRDSVPRLEDMRAGTRKTIEVRERDMRSLNILERAIARASGTWAGMQESNKADEEMIERLDQAIKELQERRAELTNRSTDPQTRIKLIQEIMRRALRVDYSRANKMLEESVQRLNKAEAAIRTTAEYVPGGGLGVGLADYMQNPDDPEAQRKLLQAAAYTALDLVPVPGAGKIGAIAGKTVGKYAEKKAGQYVAKETAVVLGKLTEKGVEKVVTGQVEKAVRAEEKKVADAVIEKVLKKPEAGA